MDQFSDVTRSHNKSPRTKEIKQQNDAHTIYSEIQDSQMECPPQELKLSDLAVLDNNQQQSRAAPRQKQQKPQKFKWTPKNTDLFYRLYVIFSGCLDLIESYFQRHVNPEIPKGTIKKKFKKELKQNPTKLFERAKRTVQQDKIQQKMVRLARKDLSLIQKWSSISEIDINQVVGVDDNDREIQNNILEQINQLLRYHKEIKQSELQNQ